MSVIANLTIPADQFALGDLLEVRSGVQVRLESMVPIGDVVVPYFWIRSPDVDAVKSALENSPFVEEVRVVDHVAEETLFRVDWADGVNGVLEAISNTEAVLIQETGHGDRWSFQLRFPESEALSTFYRGLVDKGISIDLESVHNPVDTTDQVQTQLTSEQQEALVLAFEKGYFAVPRETTLNDLAETLEISDSAVSQRIRRGLTRLLTSTCRET